MSSKEFQEDLFIKSYIPCKCGVVNHALQETEMKASLKKAIRIKKLILDHGWGLNINYYYHMDKLNGHCNAWNVTNSPYLIMRAGYQEEINETDIPLERKHA
jgi:hypothetical protein